MKASPILRDPGPAPRGHTTVIGCVLGGPRSKHYSKASPGDVRKAIDLEAEAAELNRLQREPEGEIRKEGREKRGARRGGALTGQ